MNSAGYYFALLRFLLHLGIQLWSQTGFDLISNCLFSATGTWVCCFCVEQKEHKWVGEEFSHFTFNAILTRSVVWIPPLLQYSYITEMWNATEFKLSNYIGELTFYNVSTRTWTPLLWGNSPVPTFWKINSTMFSLLVLIYSIQVLHILRQKEIRKLAYHGIMGKFH